MRTRASPAADRLSHIRELQGLPGLEYGGEVFDIFGVQLILVTQMVHASIGNGKRLTSSARSED